MIEILETIQIPISKLSANNGQIDGIPKNPRFIKDYRYQKLLKSIQDNPEFLGARELIVKEYNSKYVVLCGNMRYRAAKESGFDSIPCKVIPKVYTTEQIKAIIIKDNISFGDDDFDALANEWDATELEEWGFEMQNYIQDIDVNDMSEDDLDMTEEFDPIGISKGLVRLVIIFNGIIEAKDWIEKNVPNLEYKKKGNDDNIILQVNLSTKYGI